MQRELVRDGADLADGEEAGEEGERMCGRDLELPRPDQQVRGEGVWPGADTQVSKQSNRGGHSRVWHTIRTQSGLQGTQPAPRFTH